MLLPVLSPAGRESSCAGSAVCFRTSGYDRRPLLFFRHRRNAFVL